MREGISLLPSQSSRFSLCLLIVFLATCVLLSLSTRGEAGPEKQGISQRDLIVGEILMRREGARVALDYYTSLLEVPRKDERKGFVYYRVAKIYYAFGQYQKAYENIQKSVSLLNEKYLFYSALFLRMKIYSGLEWFREARQIARFLLEEEFVGASPEDLYLFMGNADVSLHDPLEAVVDFEKAYLYGSFERREEIFSDAAEKIASLFEDVANPFVFIDALSSTDTIRFQKYLSFLGARRCAEEKMYGFAGYFLERYTRISKFGGEGRSAEPSLPSLTWEGEGNRLVSVYLPLDGPYRRFSFEVLAGLELFLRTKRKDAEEVPLSLHVHNTFANTPLLASDLRGDEVDRNALAIVGPLTGEEARLIRPREGTPPLFYLGQKQFGVREGITSFGISPDNEVIKLLSFAFASGIRKISLFYPENGYGRAYEKAVRREAGLFAISVVSKVGYAPDTKDFTPLIRDMSGKENFARFKESKERDVKMPVDFEGIFILDVPERGFLLQSQLIYYNVKVPTFVPSSWSERSFIEERRRDLRMVYTVSDFNPFPTSRSGRQFVNRYHSFYGRWPDRFAGYGYDLGDLIERLREKLPLLDTEGEEPGLLMSRALNREEKGRGVTGEFEFFRGNVYRKLSIIRINDGRITNVTEPIN